MVSLLDHNGIWPGQAGIDETGQGWLQDPPVGVELRVQPATASETLLITPERPWERGALSPRVVLRDPVDGKLKLWYIASGEEEGSSSYIAYAESDDGYSWARPALGLVKWQGRDSNLCFDFGAFELQSVFLDPSAPPEARFKAMARDAIWHHKGEVLPSLSRERKWEIRNAMEAAGVTNTARNGSRVWRRRVSCGQVPPEQQAEELYSEGVLRGATSPVSLFSPSPTRSRQVSRPRVFVQDGKRWTFLPSESPLLNVGRTGLDTTNIAAFDPDQQRYV